MSSKKIVAMVCVFGTLCTINNNANCEYVSVDGSISKLVRLQEDGTEIELKIAAINAAIRKAIDNFKNDPSNIYMSNSDKNHTGEALYAEIKTLKSEVDTLHQSVNRPMPAVGGDVEADIREIKHEITALRKEKDKSEEKTAPDTTNREEPSGTELSLELKEVKQQIKQMEADLGGLKDEVKKFGVALLQFKQEEKKEIGDISADAISEKKEEEKNITSSETKPEGTVNEKIDEMPVTSETSEANQSSEPGSNEQPEADHQDNPEGSEQQDTADKSGDVVESATESTDSTPPDDESRAGENQLAEVGKQNENSETVSS